MLMTCRASRAEIFSLELKIAARACETHLRPLIYGAGTGTNAKPMCLQPTMKMTVATARSKQEPKGKIATQRAASPK